MKKVIILAVLCLTFCYAQNPYTLTTAEKDMFLNSHNAIRKAYNVPALTWNAQLASDSQAWAMQCKVSPLTHSAANGQYGENLATWMGSPKPSTAFPWKTMDYHVVNGWYAEEQYWNCKANTCPSGQMCGHLTQQIWASTTEVGCGIAYCTATISGKQWHVQNAVCRYKSPGNYVGQHPLGTNGATKCPVTPTKLGPFNPTPVAPPTTPPVQPVAPVPTKPPVAPVAPPVAPVAPPVAPIAPQVPVGNVWWKDCISDYWPTGPDGKQYQKLTPCAWEPWKDSTDLKTWCCPDPKDEWGMSWPIKNLGTTSCPDGKAPLWAKAEESADTVSGLTMGAWIGIAVAIAVVIIIIIVIIIIVQKKKNDERV
jgi:pathogenesis-related protein 1